MNTTGHVLIVEDEPQLAALLSDYCHRDGYQVTCLDNGNDVAPFLAKTSVDALLLDLMLPGKDGLTVCRELRQHSDIPVLMMTAKVEEIDRLLGLELGADDYICKPYSPREVMARLKAVLRRSRVREIPCSAGIRLQKGQLRVSYHDQHIDLTGIEFGMVELLSSQPERIFSRQQLMDSVYTDHRVVSDRTIDSHIKKLRKKLDQLGANDWIQSVYGVGYRWHPPQD
ncbi:response regulator [Aestuariibacter halophilus]|uniref:Response regulator n=1 Tax=Fluctibacter halophilus TaxID=226011 RepID=A0ABS8G3A6_9ALTE|nr:response regulator [Aestuariibacter halophilus]MCC2614963.1 response regulator [Aestuariibacter halophilus]